MTEASRPDPQRSDHDDMAEGLRAAFDRSEPDALHRKERDQDLGRDVAIKALRPEKVSRPEIVERFVEQEERDAFARLGAEVAELQESE